MSQEQQVTRSTFTPVERAMQDAGFSPERVKQEISFAIQHINKSSTLRKCTGESLLQAVVNISNIGLTLNPAAKEAYLVPRWNKPSQCFEAALEPGYVGLVKLLTNTGSVISVVAQIVHENDRFEVDLADNQNPVLHKPLFGKPRGEIMCVYALATLPDGIRQVEVMEIAEVNEIMERSESLKAYRDKKISTCTWITDFGEMARKTVIRRIYKYLPRTERMQVADKAIELDNADFAISDNQAAYIENLLSTSTLDQRHRDALEMEVSVMSSSRASQVIEHLKNNQLDPVTQGAGYNQGDIKRRLQNLSA